MKRTNEQFRFPVTHLVDFETPHKRLSGALAYHTLPAYCQVNAEDGVGVFRAAHQTGTIHYLLRVVDHDGEDSLLFAARLRPQPIRILTSRLRYRTNKATARQKEVNNGKQATTAWRAVASLLVL